jgi:uncharacterized membrane protein
MNKYLVIALVIAAIVIACLIGSYVFVLGAFIFKVMLGLVAVIIFALGIVVGRFFPYKNKNSKQQLNG